MAKKDELTISMVRHEMAELDHLLGTIGAALKFIAERPERNRIIYVIDYTEIPPYWEASRPRRVQDLQDKRVRGVEDYLTGLERIFLRLSLPKEQVEYLDAAYYEQAELIDGLTLNGSFETIILPNQWLRLRDDISYFSHWGDQPIASFVSPINENTQLLRDIITESKKSKKQDFSSIYQTYCQNIGFESAKFKKQARIFDVLHDYVTRANIRVPQDFSWAEAELRAPEVEKLSRGKPDSEAIERWEVHIDRGRKEYSDAYGLHGRWAHAREGAETLAWMEMADQCLQDATASHLRLALVTRNRQYQHASRAAAGHSPTKTNQPVPWVFHPRLLNAFMVDQMAIGAGAKAAFINDPTDALAEISQLRSSIRLVDEFLGSIGTARRVAIDSNSSLGRYVRNQLRRSWERYRRQGLAEQIQIRISHRKDRWDISSKGRKDKIAAFLDQIMEMRLTRTEIDRERALIGAIPTGDIWPKGGKAFHGKCLPIDLADVEFLVLFKSDDFARAFIFRSDSLKNIVTTHLSELEKSSSWDGYLDIQAIFSAVIAVFHAETIDATKEAESREGDPHNLRILRFEVLMLCAVCLAARSQCTLAKIFVAAAWAVWSDAKAGDDKTVEKQLFEIAYLESVLSRMAWRKAAYDRNVSETPSEILDTGIVDLDHALSSANNDPQHKRLALSAVGFARELYSYAALHSLNTGKIPLSVKDCLERLALTYDLSCKRRFWFTAARSKQQFLAFFRMARAGRLPARTSKSKQFSWKAAQNAYVDMVQALDHLRESDSHWNDRDLPTTTRITEAIGKWVFRSELKIGRAEIRKARGLIVKLKTNIREPGFHKHITQRVQEIDEFLKTQSSS